MSSIVKKPSILIVIVNYNGENYLNDCIDSIYRSSYKNFKVLVVDDCSYDKSLQILDTYKKIHSTFQVCVNNKNIGPSASRNVAIRSCKADYIYFLDNDTKVHKDFLKEVVSVFQSDSKTVAVQSLLAYYENREIVQNAGLKLIPQTGWAIGISDGKKVSQINTNSYILGLSAALCVEYRFLMDNDLSFDSKLFHYSEDLDFTWRIWIAGGKIKVSSKSLVFHRVKTINERANVGANMEKIYFHLVKNSIRSFIKNYELLVLLKYLPICIIVVFLRAFLVLIVRRDASSIKGTTKAFYWNILNIRDTLEARTIIQGSRKFNDNYILKNIGLSDSLIGIYKKYFKQTKLLPL